jgi:hypothetical protein
MDLIKYMEADRQMSREIKFRTWNSVTKEMEQVTQINLKNHYVQTTFNKIGYSYGQPDDVIVEQYTGLRDANGRDIYENDLVSLDPDDDPYKVIFGEGKFEIVGNGLNYDLGEEYMDCEVVGNAHTDGQLLEADK